MNAQKIERVGLTVGEQGSGLSGRGHPGGQPVLSAAGRWAEE
nr:hypothetical protein [uncultured Pseudogulbenkiania sp.]